MGTPPDGLCTRPEGCSWRTIHLTSNLFQGRPHAMETPAPLRNFVLLNGLLLTSVAIPHLIDDFLYGIPSEFGLTTIQAQILSGVFSLILVYIFFEIGSDTRRGYLAAGTLGVFLALAGTLKHVPLMLQAGPYWSGVFSEMLIIALILSGISVSALSFYALRIHQKRRGKASEHV